jgi:DNA repair exonuclease SbcCD nuclease subunit
MPNRAFRFIHAADLHLEQAPQGVAHVPDHLRDLFVDSAYAAARRVFDAACTEQVDFLILAGDVLDARRTGPRGPLFLVEQFQRLAERMIPVYWAGGTVDSPDVWPPSVTLPDNVVVFPMGKPDEAVFDRHSEPVVRLIGASRISGRSLRPNEFSGEPGGLFTIAVAHGSADPEQLKRREIEYWALGGRHQRTTLYRGPEVAHDPGSPQGRSPADKGQYGCTLVDVDERKTIRSTQVPTSVFRWHGERFEVQDASSREDLETSLRERIHDLAQAHPGIDLMISWTADGTGPLLTAIRRGPLADELLQTLRREFGFGPPALWSLTLETEAGIQVPKTWLEEETIRGDFLKAIRRLQEDGSSTPDLSEYLPERYLAGSLSAAAVLSDPQQRGRVLAEAAMLGVDLLTAEDTVS